MKEYNVGVIGYGFMGKTHILGYKTIPLFYSGLPYTLKLKGVCTAHKETANKAKEEQGFEYATTNPDDIINDPKIDMISICTPNNEHKDVIIKALKAGKHIYCDKPLTATFEEAEEVIAEVKKHPELVTQVALQNRFYPAVMRAKQLIDEGRIGRVYHFRCDYLHSSGTDPKKTIGWKQQGRYGGGVQIDLGAHAFDMVHYLLGDFENIEYKRKEIAYAQRPDKDGKPINVDAEDLAMTVVKMKDSSVGEILVSKITTGAMDELDISIWGEKGALRFSTIKPGVLEFYDATKPQNPLGGEAGFTQIDCGQKYEAPGGAFPSPRNTLGFLRAHVACLYNFVACVHEGKKAVPSFEDGAYIQKWIQ